MNVTHLRDLDERVFQTVLPNGLPVFVVPKPGFSKKSAYLCVNYGSIDTCFSLGAPARLLRSPDGTAHYLEHKMFDLPGRDVMAEFSGLGANPNAFTSYAMTAYYFSCTDHFDRCLELLLQFVSTPYFTEESVEKERGIISQEIRMYEDSADSRVYEDLFAALYRTHPVRVPIAGSTESIAAITPASLLEAYRAFYQPGNMVLSVVGDVDPESVAALAQRVLPASSGSAPLRDYGPAETPDADRAEFHRTMDVAMPTFQLGFKCTPAPKGPQSARQQLVGDLAAEALMGESSDLYLRLYRQGLIDSSFACGFEALPGAALLSCGGDSLQPEAVRDAICQEARRLVREGIPEPLFRRLVRSALGRRIRALDSFHSTCFRLCASYFEGADFWDFSRLYATITKEETEAFLQQAIRENNRSLCVVLPR